MFPLSAIPKLVPVLAWEFQLAGQTRGLALAREKGWLLAWDDKSWLYLLNYSGHVQSQRQYGGALIAACAADDGTAYAFIGAGGRICWLAPDLTPRWEVNLAPTVVAVAIDSMGQYLVATDAESHVYRFDRLGRKVGQWEAPRPIHHVCFVPATCRLVCSSDYGFVAGFDWTGQCLWRDGIVAHIGAVAVSADSAQTIVACYGEGLQRFDHAGKRMGRLAGSFPSRLASTSFDGQMVLAGGMTKQSVFFDLNGNNLGSLSSEDTVVALSLSALGDRAFIGLARGQVQAFDLRKP